MITTAKKFLLLFMALTLMMSPVSMTFANPFGESGSVVAKKECHKKQSVDQIKQMQIDKMPSDHSTMEHEKCACKTDCNHAQCANGCSDCSHCMIGIVGSLIPPPIIHPSKISLISQTLYQKSFMMQYRPPKHS